jgi:uncharacterized membrane-anchored protein
MVPIPIPIMRILPLVMLAILGLPFAGPAQEKEQANETKLSPEQKAFLEVFNSIPWIHGGQKGEIGPVANLQVPEGYIYAGPSYAGRMLAAHGNVDSGGTLGYVRPDEEDWFAIFRFDNCGYVKDDEKGSLDADKILQQMKAGDAAANLERKKLGLDSLSVAGWSKPPFYNPETQNLEWAVRLRTGKGEENVNYRTKILGRKGVLEVILVCDEKDLPTVVPQYQKMLRSVAFNAGEAYGEYRKGDKIAEYGLTGLIIGGGLLAAAKSGLLTKMIKPIIAGVVVALAALRRFFARFFGRGGGQQA